MQQALQSDEQKAVRACLVPLSTTVLDPGHGNPGCLAYGYPSLMFSKSRKPLPLSPKSKAR
jgi:hypothetical protein